MKLISFDVGIKNMAYCYLSFENSEVSIVDWGVLNMMNEEVNENNICDCIIPAKTKKQQDKVCGKKAKYTKNDRFYCEKHAKSSKDFMIPTKHMQLSYLKKQKVDELLKIGRGHFLFMNDNEKLKKDELVSRLDTFYSTKCFHVLGNKKKKSAGETDLIEIGKNMKKKMNELPRIDEITHVLIENQISPIANRMKTIQGMLAQYFIMINDSTNISFVSSSHKLKQFSDIALKNMLTSDRNTNDNKNTSRNNPNYKENKKDGVFYCSRIVEKNPIFHSWKECMNTKKKDDLADSFLQGLWYFKQHNIIYYADDLKINIV